MAAAYSLAQHYGHGFGLDWIMALRAPAIKTPAESGVLQMSLFPRQRARRTRYAGK
jgi:hypothetical protein